MPPERYYQATASETRFESIEPDPESIGLDRFHEKQEEAAKRFSEDGSDILVMGEMSGVGKTHSMKRLARASGFDYTDFGYLKEHYRIVKTFMFMGYKPSEQQLYNFLQGAGYIIVFKPILELRNGKVKGNCDAELVLQAMIEYKKKSKKDMKKAP